MGSVGKRKETTSSNNSTSVLDEHVKNGDTRVFKGKASGSHTYEFNGTMPMLSFFNSHSNYDELLSGLSRSEISHMRRWTEGHFMWGQQYKGWDNMTDSDKERTQFYDDLIDRSTIDQGFSTTRLATTELLFGKKMSTITEADLKRVMGTEVVSKGHMSTGAAEQGLTIGSSKPIEYRLFTIGATKGVGMYIGDIRVNGWRYQQREVMINRDTVWKPVGYSWDNSRKVWVVDMQYMGNQRHDYGKSGRV